ncbi:unnamed protein product [Ostreobium quekettii]|uniref:BZIP domain-containing protein n=1 Tax=Ostreobium quekettii TaxID=121088 RepID=A0A8S1ILY9_9CHLO|nr:unnamed protein product [Ostreobium quekettii]|eukprot:evm.model.scf_149.1 EVM.evm.TU.scf_149.1   scf_149:118208-122971(-)
MAEAAAAAPSGDDAVAPKFEDQSPTAPFQPPPMDSRIAELLSSLQRHTSAGIAAGHAAYAPLTVAAVADGGRVGGAAAGCNTPVLQRRAPGGSPVLVTAAPSQLIQLSIPNLGERGATGRTIIKTDNGSSDCPTSAMANGMEDVDDDMGDSGAFSRGAQRPKRYRNQKQKLSNSMAQKRYRERKKRAFMDMRQVIDSLTAEVEQLRLVKSENDRLCQTTNALEDLVKSQQDQIEALRGRIKAEANLPEASVAMPKEVELVMVSAPTDGQINPRHGTPQGASFVKAYELSEGAAKAFQRADGPGPQGPKGSGHGRQAVAPQLLVLPDGAITASLQSEWNTHILAMEQVLAANQQQGLPNGPISEDALQLLSRMVSNLYSLNGQLMSAHMQQVLEINRQNTARICRIFNGLAGCKPE